MKRWKLVLTLGLLIGSSGFADTLNSTGQTPAVSTAFDPLNSFWNNTSSDVVNGTDAANVGNFLNDSGAFALNGNVTTNCPTCGVNYMASGGQMYVNNVNNPNYVSGLTFAEQAGGLQITLLYANSGANGFAEFGLYDASNPDVNHVILRTGGATNLNNNIGAVYTSGTGVGSLSGTISLANGSPYADWGLYVTTCTEGSVSFAQCTNDGDVVTYFMGATSLESATILPFDGSHQHFALFQSGTDVNQYYAGLEDFAFTRTSPTNLTEGYGDYNDLIFGITTSIPSTSGVPEPATLPMVGLCLVGIGVVSRRKLKA
jgi:hypothetical protein